MSTIAQINVSLPGIDSPWFYLCIISCLTLLGFGSCFLSTLTANKKLEQKKEHAGFVAIAVVSGIIGFISLGFSLHVFICIFDSVLPGGG